MQLAAFLCVISAICGRITRKHTQSISTKETPMSPADLADDADKPQTDKTTKTTKTTPTQTVFLCEIMQLAAFLCVICAICGRITRKSTQSTLHTETPCVSRRSRRLSQTKPKTTTFQTVFLCEIMQLAAFSLRDLRYLRENIHASVLNLHCTQKPHVSPADHADYRRQNPKQQHSKLSFSAI